MSGEGSIEDGVLIHELPGQNRSTGFKLVGAGASMPERGMSENNFWPKQANGEWLDLKHMTKGALRLWSIRGMG